jgi:hypothetical protein
MSYNFLAAWKPGRQAHFAGCEANCVFIIETAGWASPVPKTMLTEGVWAEVVVGKEHLKLFSEHNAQGVQTSVFNVSTKSWIAPSEPADDIEDGKNKAEEHARLYLKATANLELPSLNWKKARAV